MLVIPSIDLLGGRVVRLREGRRDDATFYPDPPEVVAARYARGGARRLHVVDLDGAFAGRPENRAALGRILTAASLPVQVGGGVRSVEDARALLDLGAGFVVLGTVAVRDPEVVRSAARAFPGRVLVAVDARDGRVRVAGWTEDADEPAVDVAARAVRSGATGILYTDIARDGTGVGPNVEATVRLQMRVPAPVIASGGIASLDDVRALARAGVQACVIGRALCEGTFTVEQAIEASC